MKGAMKPIARMLLLLAIFLPDNCWHNRSRLGSALPFLLMSSKAITAASNWIC